MRKWSFVMAAAAAALAAQPVLAQTAATLVAVEGQPLPGSGGLNVTNLNTAYVSGSGKVGFLGTLSDNARFVFFDNGIVFKSSDVINPALSGGEGTMGVSDTGGFAYSPSIDGEDGIYSHVGTIARGTDPAPGIPGLFLTFNSRPRMTADGTAYWVAGTTATQGGGTSGRALYSATTTGGVPSLAPLLKGGDVVEGQTITNTGIEFPFAVSQNNANFINRVTFTGSTATDAAVVVKGDTIVAREGFPTHPGGFNWQAFRFVDINNAGNWLVYGDDNGPTTSDDILMYNGAIVARQGDTLAGVTLGTTIDAAAINNNDEIVQIWDLTSGTDEGLFYGHASNVAASILLLRTGDLLDTTGDGIADWTLTDFNASATITAPLAFGDDGLVYIDVDLVPVGGGTAVQAIIAVAVPEPGSLSLLGMGCVGLLRRRRR